VQAQDLVRVCARAERESQDRQNKYSHHLGVQCRTVPNAPLWPQSGQSKGIYNCKFTDARLLSPEPPRILTWQTAFERHAERGEKSDSGCKVVDDDADDSSNSEAQMLRMPKDGPCGRIMS
jgi:hypothetical protein